MTSFRAFFPITNYQIYPGETKSPILGAGEIPSDAPLGDAIVYTCIFTKLPRDGGVAYSEEKSAPFTITATGGGGETQTTKTINFATLSEGTFTSYFKLPSTNGILGQYTIHANAIYKTGEAYPLVARTNKTFQVNLTGDINSDGIIDYLDINVICRAFGSYPGHPRWDSRADLNGDNYIDYLDINVCARNFGKSGTY
jgi:hypothetical protein